MIYDYLLSMKMKLDDLEAKFSESCVKIGNHYNIEPEEQINLMEIMLKVQEYFLIQGQKFKAKALIILNEVSLAPIQSTFT